MSYEITTLDAFLERVNDERFVERSDVLPRVLGAQVWHAIVSQPGCLGDAHAVARNRKNALASVEYWLDEEREFSARHVRGRLRRYGICYLRDGRVITLNQHTAGELL